MRTLSIIIILLVLGTSSYAQKDVLLNEYKIHISIGRSSVLNESKELAMNAKWLPGTKKVYDDCIGFVCKTSNLGNFVIIVYNDTTIPIKLYIFDDELGGSDVIVCSMESLYVVEDSNKGNNNQFKLSFSSDYYYYSLIISVPK